MSVAGSYSSFVARAGPVLVARPPIAWILPVNPDVVAVRDERAFGRAAFAIHVATDQGMFAQRHLDASMIEMKSSTIMAALVNGEVQFSNSTGSATRLVARLRRELPAFRDCRVLVAGIPASLFPFGDFNLVAHSPLDGALFRSVGGWLSSAPRPAARTDDHRNTGAFPSFHRAIPHRLCSASPR